MSDIKKLVKCEKITEWLDPHSERLVQATGRNAPNPGTLREGWCVEENEWPLLASEVERLLIPKVLGIVALAEVRGDLDNNRVVLSVPSLNTWATCFPVNNNTNVLTRPNGTRSWAAVGMCGETIGLAVFASERIGWPSIEVRIQPVIEDIFDKIIAS